MSHEKVIRGTLSTSVDDQEDEIWFQDGPGRDSNQGL